VNSPSMTPGLRRATDRPRLLARSTSDRPMKTIEVESLTTVPFEVDFVTVQPVPFTPTDAPETGSATTTVRRSVHEGRTRTITRTERPGEVPPANVSKDVRPFNQLAARNALISCVIPCYNEQDSIADVLVALLAQTRMPDAIYVVVNNTDDDTIEIAGKFAGEHTRIVRGVEFHTVVEVHDMGVNPDKKVGALNYGYVLSRGRFDFILGVDGDTSLDYQAVEWLEREMVDDRRIGGLSAVYSIDKSKISGATPRFLVAGQRAQFAGFNMDNLLHGRNMAVLGGQCSLFSVAALEDVMVRNHQESPWVRDSQVEDSKLSLQIKDAGYSTKISARARANVGPMTTLRGLHSQQVKWNYGGIDLLWPGQRGDTKGQPLHPNLRLRWWENISMLFNVVTRMGFALLLAAALSIHAFVFNPVWLIPPAVAIMLNLRIATAMRDRGPSDLLYAALFFPAEAYMWIRMGHFLTAWAQFFAHVEKDNWAAQAAAERGRGSADIIPAIFAVAVFGVLIFAWSRQSVDVKSTILSIGWPVLYIVTITQTAFMLKKLVRRQRGFSV
jgi:biofilm PGA synthesis N-glycosyltransferase PgaC